MYDKIEMHPTRDLLLLLAQVRSEPVADASGGGSE